MSYQAVIFDIGGVVYTSPLHTIDRYEAGLGIDNGFINRVVVETGQTGAWSRLERGEIDLEEFYSTFDAECLARGREIGARRLMGIIADTTAPRPQMLVALHQIRRHGLKTAALTNNWKGPEKRRSDLSALFDHFIESSVIGLRKPDPRIYEHALAKIGVEARQCVFLDDIGRNLKPARQLGVTTIKVEDPDQALSELASVLGISLAQAES